MKVEIRKAVVGTHPGLGEFCFREGEVRELPDDLAVKWLASGVVSAVKEQRETAAVEPAENAIHQVGKKRKASGG